MQGSGATDEVKWQTGVINTLQSDDVNLRADMMCLQECGPFPASSKEVKQIKFRAPDASENIVRIFSLGGTSSRPFGSIVFHQWDTKGGRVNTALAYKGEAPEDAAVKLVWPATGANWRPSLGVKSAAGWVFSFHAISPKGPDAAEMLKAIVSAAGSDPWVVGADWNQEPGEIKAIPANCVVCVPNAPTYPTKAPVSRYDFLVRSGATKVEGKVTSLVCSDHRPVAYTI